VLDRLTALIGRPHLPPRWALGYQQTRWGYETADEIRQVAHELRARRLPADVVGLDIDAMDEYRVFTWDDEAFPEPSALTKELAEDGFKVTAIVDTAVKHAAGRPVTVVTVRIGHLRQVVPSSLQFAFELVAQGTVAEGAELVMEMVPAAGRCRACGAESPLPEFPLRCASCGGLDMEVVRGEELLVDSLELEEPVTTNGGMGRGD